MTTREFYNAVVNDTINDEVKEMATALIAKLDKKNENRSSKPSKTAVANEPIKQSILDLLTEKGAMISADIATALEISTQKASALCRQLVDDGKCEVGEVKLPKKGKVKSYAVKA